MFYFYDDCFSCNISVPNTVKLLIFAGTHFRGFDSPKFSQISPGYIIQIISVLIKAQIIKRCPETSMITQTSLDLLNPINLGAEVSEQRQLAIRRQYN